MDISETILTAIGNKIEIFVISLFRRILIKVLMCFFYLFSLVGRNI